MAIVINVDAWLLSSLPSSHTNVTKGGGGGCIILLTFCDGLMLVVSMVASCTKTNVVDWTANCVVQSNKISEFCIWLVQWLPLASPLVDPIAIILTKDHWALW